MRLDKVSGHMGLYSSDYEGFCLKNLSFHEILVWDFVLFYSILFYYILYHILYYIILSSFAALLLPPPCLLDLHPLVQVALLAMCFFCGMAIVCVARVFVSRFWLCAVVFYSSWYCLEHFGHVWAIRGSWFALAHALNVCLFRV